MIIQNLPVMENLLGEHKHKTLSELGLDPWSEEQFQKLIVILAHVKRKNYRPCYEHFRLWGGGYTDMDGKYLKRQIPFDYLLCNDKANTIQKQGARRVAETMLRILKTEDQRFDKTVTAAQARCIEHALAWLIPTTPTGTPRYLSPLIFLAERGSFIYWDRLEQLFTFIKNQKNTSPDPELLEDYINGYVDIRGIGKIRAQQE